MLRLLERTRVMHGLEMEITRRFNAYGADGFADYHERRELSARVADESGGQNVLEWIKDSSQNAVYMPTIFECFGAKESPIADARVGAVHPAFIVNNVNVKDLYLGKYLGTLYTAPDAKKYLLSLRGMDPAASQTLATFNSAAQNANTGAGTGQMHHVMTQAEYAYIALLCKAQGFQPDGNILYGKDSINNFGDISYMYDSSGVKYKGRTLTGSGPLTWNRDGSPYGMGDLCGNVYEFAPGYRLNAGVIQIVENNNAASSDSTINSVYKSVLGDGNLAALGTVGEMRFRVAADAADYDIVVTSGPFKNILMVYKTGSTTAPCPTLLKELCIIPHDSGDYGGDYFYLDTTSQRLCVRGGSWDYGTFAGVFCADLNFSLSGSNHIIGARPAFLRA